MGLSLGAWGSWDLIATVVQKRERDKRRAGGGVVELVAAGLSPSVVMTKPTPPIERERVPPLHGRERAQPLRGRRRHRRSPVERVLLLWLVGRAPPLLTGEERALAVAHAREWTWARG
uniref:Uncharacterized protein n=1 Tax=Oryza sativa subsp. japonica TaxID=39947 RepID=Q5VPT4_ORYSJ|nr:hypothetical protein [Oryza sativa Japonica Group]